MKKDYLLGVLMIAAVTASALSFTLPAATAAIEEPVTTQYSGIISAIDEAGSTLIVRGAQASQTFKVATDAVIITKDKPAAKLGDLKIGDKVDVVYQRKEGDTTFTATRIEVIGK